MQIKLKMKDLVHLDHVISVSSVVKGWQVKETEAFSICIVSDLRYQPLGSPLDSLDSLLVSTVEGTADNVAILQMWSH